MSNQTVKSETSPVYCAKIYAGNSNRAKHVELTDNQIIERAREILRAKNERVGDKKMTNPRHVRDLLDRHFFGVDREEFAVIFLDSQHGVIKVETLFKGTINKSAVYPREIAKRALELNAAAIIIAHNHPSGEVEPSRVDFSVTDRIVQSMNLLDINVLDHFVVDPYCKNEAYSFAENGRI